MKALINEYGTLYLEKKGKLIPMICPFKNRECGDWCPLFSEPKPVMFIDKDKPCLWELSLCLKTYRITEFIDRRK